MDSHKYDINWQASVKPLLVRDGRRHIQEPSLAVLQVLLLDDLLTASRSGNQQPESSRQHSSRGKYRLAFILFTSGSSGKPKGVLLEHAGLINMAMHCKHAWGCRPSDVHLQAASVSFDALFLEFLVPMCLGGCTAILPPGAQMDPEAAVQRMSGYPITTLFGVPSLLHAWLAAGLTQSTCPLLRRVLVGGEACRAPLVRQILDSLPEATVINCYGPAEASVFVANQAFSKQRHHCAAPGGCAVSPPPDATSVISIGCPIINVSIHILDQQQKLVPVRVAGEICISGLCLARGYAGLADLSEASFVPNPFCSAGPNSRLYKTGDLGRWRHDGTIEIIGRADRQVLSPLATS